MNQHTHTGTTVLITGASSGLGAEFARQLASRGADLILVARRRDRLEALAAELTGAHGHQVHVVEADLGVPGAAAHLVETLEAQGLRVDFLINNAGFGIMGEFKDQTPEQISGMVALNVMTLTELTRLLLPQLLQGNGVLLNVASTGAFQPLPRMAVYGATKAYVLSLTEAIAAENRGSGLRVLALCPGATRTEFFEVAGSKGLVGGKFHTSEQVVRVALDTLDRRSRPDNVVPGRINWLASRAVGVLPRRLVLEVAKRIIQ